MWSRNDASNDANQYQDNGSGSPTRVICSGQDHLSIIKLTIPPDKTRIQRFMSQKAFQSLAACFCRQAASCCSSVVTRCHSAVRFTYKMRRWINYIQRRTVTLPYLRLRLAGDDWHIKRYLSSDPGRAARLIAWIIVLNGRAGETGNRHHRRINSRPWEIGCGVE